MSERCFALGASLGAMIMTATVGAEQLDLVRDGQPRAAIVLPSQPEADEQLAAEELQQYVETISGARMSIVTGAGVGDALPIRIGLASAPDLASVLGRETALPDACVVDVSKAGITLGGLSPQGTLFAAYELLEKLGVRWYLPGELGTVIPSRRTVSVELGRTVRVPSFASRHLQAVPATLPWYRHQRLGGPVFPSSHNIRLKPRIGDGDEALLALVGDKRRGHQLCISNPTLLDRAVAYALDYFTKHPDAPWIGMGPADGAGFCECPGCRELDGGEWDAFSAEPSMTDRYIWFFNQVLARIHPTFPGKKIGFYCYHTYQLPPRKWTPDPHIVPAFAPITLCRIHGMSNPVCPDRSFYKTLMVEWGKILPETYERGYYFNLACPQFPFSKIHAVRDETRVAHDAGVKGWRVECISSWACTGPTLYVAARLMWDVHADVDALLAEFYELFFGPAAKPMGEYLELVDHAFRDTDCHTGGSFCMPQVFPPKRLALAEALIRKAVTLAGEAAPWQARVAMFRDNHERLSLFLRMLEAEKRADFAAAKAAHDQMVELSQTMADTVLATAAPVRGKRKATAPLLYGRAATGYVKRFWTPTVESGHERTAERGQLVTVLPDEWDFQIDPKDLGEQLTWQRDGTIGGNWRAIRTLSASWSDQGLHYYKGHAWYRTTVTLPESTAGRKLFLWFGGVDEKAKVWLNGTLLGTSADPGEGLPGVAGAFRPFDMDATEAARPGAENTIAVKITNLQLNEVGTGGIVAPVMFWTPR
ncbi:MAG: DUF4838 domain-containing protein [Lentisphaerae bacterium]|jgi:hypothetical protein|nr:DUF4838 domain-containing protein [Lentisphaerota bacterium]MBT4823527.1 DUF4838 domain-containing protein [Lentisphaerota bacterium]MBT5606915.1 DUF4838 domain-containing protein [Lentisphaerota bacterium]MBT7059799.1 DUF4838 domain-containing protein [Lentisphaerota bacterium]MBT7841335.1 DUF4838 domain-containing protein [Lentisphaerota bacterium]